MICLWLMSNFAITFAGRVVNLLSQKCFKSFVSGVGHVVLYKLIRISHEYVLAVRARADALSAEADALAHLHGSVPRPVVPAL